MSLMSYNGQHLLPGQLASYEAIEQELTSIIWDKEYRSLFQSNVPIDGAARDVGNIGHTDVLRPGLLLTRHTVTGKWLEWGAEAGQSGALPNDLIQGVLILAQKMQLGGTDTDRFVGYILVGGCVKVNGLIIPGAASVAGIVGNAEETNVRQQMHPAFIFDDDPLGHLAA